MFCCAFLCVPYINWPLNSAILLILKDQQLDTSICVLPFFPFNDMKVCCGINVLLLIIVALSLKH